jgi:hypothetical protein
MAKIRTRQMKEADRKKRGSYSAVAAHLNERFSGVIWAYAVGDESKADLITDRPFVRQDIELWHRRETRNAAGIPFPAPAEEISQPLRTQPRLLFDFAEVVSWAEAGVPGSNRGQGWRYPVAR